MNIKEAKEEIVRTIRAYTARDNQGCWRIPAVRQRPMLLIGPPGIGKTAIMEQAAEECGTGLVAYTITHHTRQSAVGLPQLVTKKFQDTEYTMTEYTMSEIVGSIYEYEERTGYREGILFIDEINCVSETLAPTMLQFLQYKMFGNHRVPEGWIIVAAGNPGEYNRSVRELDMAVSDRVRTLNVEADLSVWKDYALQRGIHPSVLSYLELHPEHFYQVTLTRDKKEFVTARGWEDLSEVLKEYERQGFPVDRSFVEEFLRVPKIAGDFTAFYQLSRAHLGAYRIQEFIGERLTAQEKEELKEQLGKLPGDVRCMFLRHMLSAASERMTACGALARRFGREKEVLGQFLSYMKEPGEKSLEEFLMRRSHALKVRRENALLKPWEEQTERSVDEWLKRVFFSVSGVRLLEELKNKNWSEDEIKSAAGIPEEEERLRKAKEDVCGYLNRMTDFIAGAFGEELELTDWLYGIKSHGDYGLLSFERPGMERLLNQRGQEAELRKQMEEMEGLYEVADRK